MNRSVWVSAGVYGVAFASLAVALLLRWLLDPVLGEAFPVVTLFGAVAVAVGIGGYRPALLVAVLGYLANGYLFISPRGQYGLSEPRNVVGLFAYLITAFIIIGFGEALRRARLRCQREEEAARQQAERMQTTLASIGDGVIATDTAGRVTTMNAVAEALTGWTDVEAAGLPLMQVFRIVNESTRLEVENPALRALREGTIVGLANHTVLIAKDGVERAIDDSAAPIRGSDGTIVGCVLVFRDISERHRVESEQREARQQLAMTLESVTDGFMRYDRDWRIVYVNAEAERINKLTRSEMLGKILWEVFPAVVGSKLEVEFRRAVAEQVTVEFENHYEPFGRWYSLKGYPTSDGGLTTFIRDITEQKRVEQRLVESEARYREIAAESERQRRLYETVLSNIPDFVYVFSLDHRVLYANESLIKMWGRGREGAIGKTFLEIGYEPWHAAMHDREIDQVRATRQPIRGEVPFHGTLGRRQYDYIFVPIIGADGEVEAVAGTTRDVTERKEAEERLRASEERSAFVRRSTGVGFWYCDLPFDVLQWDDLVKAHFHFPSDAIVTIQTFYDRLHPDDREPTRRAIEQSIADRSPYNVDYRTLHPDTGAVRWVRAIGRTFYTADGAPTRFDGVTLDVSDQKRAEALLRESEEQRRLALDAAELGAWHIDPATNALTTDERFRIIFAGSTEPMDFEQAFAAIHPDDRERIREAVAAATRADDPIPYAEEYRVVHADGSIRWVSAKGRANYDRKVPGRLLSFDGTVADITARKLIEEERERLVEKLRDADRRKDVFLATLAHELRNPLAPIRNGLHVMRLVGTNGTMEQTRTMMERQLTQLVRLVDDLLDMSRVTSGKLELRRECVDLRTVIDSAVETSRPVIEQAGHELTVRAPDEPILVDGDATRLAQVASNLLNNSAKYTRPGGHVRLNVHREGNMVVLAVADNGIGIPPAMLGKVFEMFAQVDRALEKTTGGLGIGLSLVKGLVEMHGGKIEARSDGEGRGSEFIVRLPTLVSAAANVERPVTVEPLNSSSRRRILVADDNIDSADSLSQLLELLGNDVRTANDGLQAVDIATIFRPDIILLDIAMPNLNGYDACRRLREQPCGKNAILVAMTGWGQDEDKRRSQDAGFDHHLVKPVDPAALEKLLSALKA